MWTKVLILISGIFYFVLDVASAASLNVLVIVDPANYVHMSKIVRKSSQKVTLSDGSVLAVHFIPFPLNTSNYSQSFEVLCGKVQNHNVSALVTLSRYRSATFVAVTIANQVSIPIIGYLPKFASPAFQDINPSFLNVAPSDQHLSQALATFFKSNSWFSVVLLSDGSVSSLNFKHRLEVAMKDDSWTKLIHKKIYNLDRIKPTLIDLEANPTRIVILHCDRKLSKRILSEAKQYNLLNHQWIWILTDLEAVNMVESDFNHPSSKLEGILAIKIDHVTKNRPIFRAMLKLLLNIIKTANATMFHEFVNGTEDLNCSVKRVSLSKKNLVKSFHREMLKEWNLTSSSNANSVLTPTYSILNFVQNRRNNRLRWHKIGNVTKSNVYLHTVTWLGGSAMTPSSGNTKLRVVTTFAPPLVMCSTFLYNTSNCLRGVQCVQLSTKNKDEIAVLLADFESKQSLRGINYNVTCCSGISIELLRNLAADLKFDFTLYLVADSEFGVRRNNTWSGLTGDLVSGAAHLAVSSFSVTNSRSRVIDFSVPYFYSDIASVTVRLYKAVPLSAFLVPFSLELWISIFASLNAAAVAAAIYEWLSPFGLNPWGRQRTKNFSLASALWVMWSLLFSHLVAFKAPKSWPNKVLINLWGCFSVIFLASYTANIAALFAGLFFQARVNHVHDAFLLEHRVGTTRGSSTEIYMMKENPRLFQHLQKFSFDNVEDGINKLQNRKLDIIIGDRAILDYYRGRDSDCNLAILGQPLYHDSYAIGVQKGFPMKDAISNLLIKYTEVGHIDDLKAKWYGDMPCFERGADIVRPQALTPNAVAGVFMMLGCGFLVGVLILSLEHLVFKYYLPRLRKKSKKSFWKSPNLMFFSQKLYRFINCVELVSPHHSAKEIASNLRAGQIFSLFQKSVKRKAKEDARRRKSKSLFFEMIQEVTRRKKQSDLSVDEKHSQYRRKSSSKSRRQRNSEIEMISHDTVDSLPIAECHRPKCEESTEECTEQSSLLVKCSGRSNVVSKNEGERSTESVDVVSYYSRPISVSLNDIHMPINEVIDGRCCRFYENFESHPCRNRVHSDSDVLRQLSENIDDSELLTENKSTESAIDVENRLTTKVLPVDEFKLKVLDKDKIVAMWLESEFELRRRLREVIKEKASLESKLSSLQAFLRKPP